MTDGTGINLMAEHNPLAFLLYLTKMTVTLDGSTQKLGWGRNFLPCPPGAHQLELSFGYLGTQRGPASATVTVPAAGYATVNYRMPSWMFAKGRITVP